MPSFQPMVPGTTLAWTAHTNSSVPALASGEIIGILCYYYREVFDYRYVVHVQIWRWPLMCVVSVGSRH